MSENKNTGSVFNVTSNDQQGGVTAGVVNIFQRAKIWLSDENKRKVMEVLKNKNNTIYVSLQTGGGSELTQFAEEIKLFLTQEGYTNIIGVNPIMGFSPFKGVNIEKKSETESVIFIGSLL